MRYEIAWRCVVEAEQPLEAMGKAKVEMQTLLDSSAPLAFEWVSFDDRSGGLQAKAVSVLMPDGSIRTSTSRQM